MSNSSQYEALYRDLVANIEEMHKGNVRKTSAALKSLLIIPTLFLIMLFLTSSSKSIFLVLWIVSMFVIAGILIVIEYQDYKLQHMLSGIKDKEAALPPHTENVSANDHGSAPEMQKAEQIRQSIYSRAPSESPETEQEVPVEVEAEPETDAAEAEAAVEEAAEAESENADIEAEAPAEATEAENEAAIEASDENPELITK